jgi:hypothetical protein
MVNTFAREVPADLVVAALKIAEQRNSYLVARTFALARRSRLAPLLPEVDTDRIFRCRAKAAASSPAMVVAELPTEPTLQDVFVSGGCFHVPSSASSFGQ